MGTECPIAAQGVESTCNHIWKVEVPLIHTLSPRCLSWMLTHTQGRGKKKRQCLIPRDGSKNKIPLFFPLQILQLQYTLFLLRLSLTRCMKDARVVPSVKRLTFGFDSGCEVGVTGWTPRRALHSAGRLLGVLSLPLPLPAPPLCPCPRVRSLFLSKINTHLKK